MRIAGRMAGIGRIATIGKLLGLGPGEGLRGTQAGKRASGTEREDQSALPGAVLGHEAVGNERPQQHRGNCKPQCELLVVLAAESLQGSPD